MNYFKPSKLVSVFGYLVLGLILVISISVRTTLSAGAANISQPSVIESDANFDLLEDQGQVAYGMTFYHDALELWQHAQEIAQRKGDVLSQAKIKGKIALAYYQLNDFPSAIAEIAQAKEILTARRKKQAEWRVWAQLLNNQGIIELANGNKQMAIILWDEAINSYQKAGDDLGVIRAQFNQARAYQNSGLYQRAINSFSDLVEKMEPEADSRLKAIILRSYGDILCLVGSSGNSQKFLEESIEIASRLNLPEEEALSLLSLGNTLVLSAKLDRQDNDLYEQALVSYQAGTDICKTLTGCSESDLAFSLELAKLNLMRKTQSWDEATKIVSSLQQHLSKASQNQQQVHLKIRLADSLSKLRQQTTEQKVIQTVIPDFDEIITLTEEAIADAQKLHDLSAQSQGLGLKGHILEIAESWDKASVSTTKALTISQRINAQEISYLWEWQLGRIDRAMGKRDSAIAHYLHGVALLEALSHDVANMDNNIQFFFHNRVEPVYRETVDLLLDNRSTEISQQDLIRVRDTLEALQIAELNNFFREACIEGEFVDIDAVDQEAAAIYPIVLEDRLEIILSLPDKPLQRFRVEVSQQQLEETITALRQKVVIRSRRTFYQPAQELYQWLIAPISDQLQQSEIKTLVFIPDGALRNLPLAALYDGDQYLVDKYSLVLNPGMQLLDPQPLEKTELNALAVGLSESQDNFAPLEYVSTELAQIKRQLKGEVLLDEKFTPEALKSEITYSDYPIVHIATHGQFSSSLDETFLLAWNDRINPNELRDILQVRGENNQKAIELLVLSACETATGDNRATLGLAGMAIQAGAKSTIATLWSINDQATAQLMGKLYQKISQKDIGKAEAIRQAQLSLLHDPKYQHPFYWAAYTTIGNWL